MHPTRHRFTIPPEIQGRIAGGDLRLLVSSGLPVMEDAAPFSPISNPKIVRQFLLLCGSPRVMQLGLNVETGEVGAIWPWAPPCFANSSPSLYADSINAFAEGVNNRLIPSCLMKIFSPTCCTSRARRRRWLFSSATAGQVNLTTSHRPL